MNRGSIILIPFYFTDFKGFKYRPAIVVSSNQSQQNDYIVAFISTIIPDETMLHESHLIIKKNDPDFLSTDLRHTSIVKCDKLMTVNISIIEGLMGELSPHVLKTVDEKLKIALSLN